MEKTKACTKKGKMEYIRKFAVVRPPTGGVNKTASDARYKQLIRNLELNNMVEVLLPRFEHRIEFLSLDGRPREAVEDEAI